MNDNENNHEAADGIEVYGRAFAKLWKLPSFHEYLRWMAFWAGVFVVGKALEPVLQAFGLIG